MSSYREFVFPRLSHVSLEHRPAQLRARQSGTRLQFIGQMVGFFSGRSVEMRMERLAVVTPVEEAIRKIIIGRSLQI